MVRALPLSILFCLLASDAVALRCANGLVDVGDHKVEVLDACGEPRSREKVLDTPVRIVHLGGVPVRQALAGGVVTEEWVYEFSPQRFRRLLRFRGRRLLEIRALDKPD